MADLAEIKQIFNEIKNELNDIEKSLDIPTLKESLQREEEKMNSEGFWDNNEKAQITLKEIKNLKSKIDCFSSLKAKEEDSLVLIEMIEEDFNEEESEEVLKEVGQLKKELASFTLSILLNGEYDNNNAIVSIHPGAGGTESQDWAEMLLRMYMRFGERMGFKVKTLDYLDGDVAGIKSVTLLFEGVNAYGYLKAEKGVHRLVRLSPFDSAGRRHTSFASIDVVPEINEEIEIDINMDDLRVDTYRSGGAGGQHVNKTDSAVRLTHLPTGIVVACQNERSQRQNKETALKILKGKLIEILEQEHKDKISDIKGDYGQITWGNQIRSYVFHPYSMVKDHRTNTETGNVTAVMDGDIEMFIDSYLKNNIK